MVSIEEEPCSAPTESPAPPAEETETTKVSTPKEKTPEEVAEADRRKKVGEFVKCDKTLGNMTTDEKYEFVDKYREAGNLFFREGKFTDARKTYQEAMTFIQHALHLGNKKEGEEDKLSLGGAPRVLDERSAQMMVLYISNSVACCLKEKDFKKAIELCNKADGMDYDIPKPQKAKLCFRRAEALMGQEKLEQAMEQYDKAYNLEPSDKGVGAARERARLKIKAMHAKEHEAAKAMWGGKLAKDKTEEILTPPMQASRPVSETATEGTDKIRQSLMGKLREMILVAFHMVDIRRISAWFPTRNAN
mmetsp:Transcript_30875/g.42782  ORF Transcript_30875/g.42782 Transcript_30875/m.42782 type:complete len:305 (+) Transcript_30875:104-1018(+)|eukprot:CAMPEP_0196582236 /NCGR_PEP_ID=MMETSP1081-20130531/38154_1 /TAXON_ID=36882 /ORGANISM="Pyramimonas amylifera, Strain CCMP720" /LENGTH=304 /DNA_ID=CAMNT_0041902739 /DNA_START=100 /DNA_END=1014 /DNA_ORIENTATION=+